MYSISISPRFNKKNLLEIILKNTSEEKLIDIKVCFSLVYSIKSLEAATIFKQVGRYYELILNQNIIYPKESRKVILKLQTPRIGTYNLSCGPEGLFILSKNNNLIKIKIKNLVFQNPIKSRNYNKFNLKINNPILPEPFKTHLTNQFINNSLKKFKILDNEIKNFLSIIKPTLNKLDINFNSSSGVNINFSKKEMNQDEYIINIQSDKIIIFTNSYGGKIYAIITLIHLLFFYDNNLPIGEVEDKPRFKWRGMHLDCSRQFHSINEIKRLLIYMSIFKLNRFHWHLTDNEAWRLDLQSFPELAKKSSFRGYNQIIPPLYGSGYDRSGGYYSNEDVKELIQFAKNLNIEIMPEIDLPAHSWALIQVMPELYDKTSNHEFQDVGNYKNNTINPALNETQIFLKKIIRDISNLFSFNIVHVGVDERPKKAWEFSQKINEFMKKNNITTSEELQDFYMNNIINLLKINNKRTAAWNEAALPPHNDIGSAGSSGNIEKNCLIFAWEHADVSIESVKRGFETIMCPGQKTYFDMSYNNSTEERGICWAGTIETSEIHSWNPLSIIDSQYHNLILGIQGHLWSETLTKKEYLDQMINPRLATLAEVAWSSDKRRGWETFRTTLSNSIKLLSKIGWKFHDF